ncbi:MAG: thioesterase family protein [Anaerolineales bacterium]
MTIPSPLSLYRDTARAEWMDYNGHMMDGYYLVAFAGATEALLQYLGFGEAYREQTGCTIYTVEGHISFVRELREGAPLRFTTLVLGADAKRLHIFHNLYHAHEDYLAATTEQMWLHVNQRTMKVEPMPADRLAQAQAIVAAHASLPPPPQAGRRIAMSASKADGAG